MVLAIALLAVGAYSGSGDDTGYFLVASLIAIVTAAVLYWIVLPRITRVGRGALIIGVLAVVSIPVFWLGFPTVLGGAAIALGLPAREQVAEAGKATAGLALGALAIVAHVVLAFVG